jgi:hypothetical protein
MQNQPIVFVRDERAGIPTTRTRCFGLTVAVVCLGLWGWSNQALACTTPVYRYAMYNWGASPFVVCYLYRGEPADKDEPLNRMIKEAGTSEPAAANIVLESINLDEWKPERVPPRIRELLQARAEGPLPAYVVLTPWGVELPAEKFDRTAAESLIDSPVRTRLAKLLDQGHAAVFLLVPGSDPAENERSEAAVRETIAQAASGRIPGMMDASLPVSPGQPPGNTSEDEIAAANRLELAMVKLDRSDKAEQWLLRSLMNIEPDLHEYKDQPMVFAIYGRGRSMEPYIGKGITVENLCDMVAFLTGACSCMVKEQNPGVDLLFRWDWEATADRMAQNDPTLAPPGMGYQEYPAIAETDMTSEDAPLQQDAASEPEATPETTRATAAPTELAVAEPGVSDPPQTATAMAAVSAKESPSPETAEPPASPASATVALQTQSPPVTSLVARQLWTLGLGVVAAAVVVLAAGFVVFRRQSR